MNYVIGLDVDGVLADFVEKVLFYQNTIYKTNFKHSDITSYAMEPILGEDNLSIIFDRLECNRDVKSLSLIFGAKEMVEELRKIGRVVFVTAPCPFYRGWADDRMHWLKKHFNASHADVVSISDKTLFSGDILIDDSSKNIESWLNLNKPAIRVSQPWNQNGPGIEVKSLSEIPDIVFAQKQMLEVKRLTSKCCEDNYIFEQKPNFIQNLINIKRKIW